VTRAAGRFLWTLASVAPTALAQNGTVRTNMLPLSVLEATLRVGAILLRIVGSWSVKADTDDLNGQVTLGLYMQRLEAFTAGVAPEMELDEYPYLHMETMNIRVGNTGTPSDAINQWHDMKLDLRTKRKFRSQEDTLVLQRENTSDAALSATTLFTTRVLLWVP